MKSIILLLAWGLLMVGTCSDEDTATFTLGESFTLMPGETLSNKAANLSISLAEVLEDSRCPKNTNCVWEGQAKVKLLVNEEAIELTLRSGKPDMAQQLFNNTYIIEAQQLNPYPDGTKLDPTAYRLQLVVNSL